MRRSANFDLNAIANSDADSQCYTNSFQYTDEYSHADGDINCHAGAFTDADQYSHPGTAYSDTDSHGHTAGYSSCLGRQLSSTHAGGHQ